MTRVILASGSESRRRLLANAGVTAEAVRPNVDEDAAKATFRAKGMRVSDQAMQLAELKAVEVSQRREGLGGAAAAPASLHVGIVGA